MENGDIVQVDDEDYAYIIESYDLKVNEHGYVYCSPKKKWKGKMALFSITLHKLLKNPEKKGRHIVVDHKDGNKLNNQKDNLRVTSHKNNMRNRKVSVLKTKSSKFKGVCWHTEKQAWLCQINVDSVAYALGTFSNEIAAANCYNYHAIKNFGEYALINSVPFMSEETWKSYQLTKNKSSQYKGVSLVDGKYLAQIYHNGKNIRLGAFDSEVDAALEYNKKAIELKGNHARLNIIT